MPVARNPINSFSFIKNYFKQKLFASKLFLNFLYKVGLVLAHFKVCSLNPNMWNVYDFYKFML